MRFYLSLSLALFTALLGGCEGSWNDPYPGADRNEKVLYAAFSERPKHLDPARSYSSDEYKFIGQIYQPPLQYHYLDRPYRLVPLTLETMPDVRLFNEEGEGLSTDAPLADIAYSEYTLEVKKGIRYQPHPALAVTANGEPVYGQLDAAFLEGVHTLSDFPETGSREVLASDYVYEIKRLAHPENHSPIAGLMAQYIVGLDDLQKRLTALHKSGEAIDLEKEALQGVELIDPHTYRIRIKGHYPQFRFWLAMPFFAPMPPEADRFYAIPGLKERNISADWYPLGSGAYMLTENNPNRRMVLARNPNFTPEPYPAKGNEADKQKGLLDDAGKAMPFIDRAIYSLDKETIPRWSKFLQGWYDASAISSDSFDQAVHVGAGGGAELTEEMREKGIGLSTSVASSNAYFGFNMLDETVGGYDEPKQKLRQAISMALDWEEYISIFLNGRGVPAQGPLPPGIWGSRKGEQGMNALLYNWVNGKPQRKGIDAAKALLAEAGYANGKDPKTGKPLLLNFEAIVSSAGDSKARLDWFRKQFKKLGIQLVVRSTDYNRFREKMMNGSAQMYMWGWNADYPDPENFLFLLHGPQSKVKHKGENASNYENPRVDALFDEMKNMPNGEERQALIDEIIEILRKDSPWSWGYHPVDYSLHHAWYHNAKPNLFGHNTLKYKRIDPAKRAEKQALWNTPILWPMILLVILLIAAVVPAYRSWKRSEQQSQKPAS